MGCCDFYSEIVSPESRTAINKDEMVTLNAQNANSIAD
jgi:hypothetical protein